MIDLMKAPFPVTYRELWLPPAINGNATLPASVRGGHGLTLTGARKGSTADGVHFIAGVATSNVKFTDPYDAVNDWWCSIRFKLDQPFASGDTDQYLIGKYDDATNYLIVWLDGADGKLKMEHREGNGAETIVSAETSWNTGWHNVLVSCSTTNGQRLIIDGGTPVTEPTNQTAISLTADMCIGARDDGTSTEGSAGVIVDVVMGSDTLSTDEEADLYKGIPPSDAVNFYPLDEGRGVTAYDRGSGADNGTLDTSCTWAFGQVQQPVISLDAINDRAVSSAGMDISGDLTLVWVGKIKSTYEAAETHRLFSAQVDGANFLSFYAISGFYWYVMGNSIPASLNYALFPAIDTYLVFIATVRSEGVVRLFANGISVGIATGAGVVSGLAATAYIGCSAIIAQYDISKPLFIALIDGAFTQKQALAYSRYLKNIFNLPITI